MQRLLLLPDCLQDEHCANDWTPYAKPQRTTAILAEDQGDRQRNRAEGEGVVYTNPARTAAMPMHDGLQAERDLPREDGMVVIDRQVYRCKMCPMRAPARVST